MKIVSQSGDKKIRSCSAHASKLWRKARDNINNITIENKVCLCPVLVRLPVADGFESFAKLLSASIGP